MTLFFISLLMIVTALSTIVLSNNPVTHYAMVLLCLAGIWLMYTYWRKLFNQMRSYYSNGGNQAQVESAKKGKPNQTGNKGQKEPSPSRQNGFPAMPISEPLSSRIDRLKTFFPDDHLGEHGKEYRRLFADLSRAAYAKEVLAGIGKTTTGPMMDNMKSCITPIDEAKAKELDDQMFQLALTAIDLTSGFSSSLEGNSSIATDFASGRITKGQAVAKAIQANDNVMQTPTEIRVLRSLATKRNGFFIVNDYKLTD